MTQFTKQYSRPIEIHNSIQACEKEDLKLSKAHNTYRAMLEDATISGSTSFIKSLLNRKFTLKPHLRSTKAEKELVEALNKSLEDLKPYNFNRTMSNVLSLVEYGTSIQEVTFHRKNGKQVFKTFSPISLQSVKEYVYDKGELVRLELNPPMNDGLIKNVTKSPTSVDGSKVLMFSFMADSDNPLGRSLLRGCYSSWKELTAYRELQLIAASKNLGGVLKVEVPSEYLASYYNDPTSDHAVMVDNLIHQAKMMGQGLTSFVALPSDTTEGNAKLFDVQPIKGVDGNGFEIEASIARCQRSILMALQSSVLSLGQDGESSGSYGLSSTKSVLLNTFLSAIQDTIAAEFMKAVRLAFELNGLTDNHLPTVVWDDIASPTWEEFTSGIKEIGMSGLVEPTGEMDQWIKQSIGAPIAGGTSGKAAGMMREAREASNANDE